MSRVNLEHVKSYDHSLEMGTKFGVNIFAIAGATFTLDRDSPTEITIDPGQALTLTLPAPERGLMFIIWHQSTGNFDITVSSPVTRLGAAGATTMGTISQNEGAIVQSDGRSWFVGVLKQT
jgi:hypothetical protein